MPAVRIVARPGDSGRPTLEDDGDLPEVDRHSGDRTSYPVVVESALPELFHADLRK